ncbi:MAG TPA: hypothetical protein VGN16_09725 [Acidobacteriaceae bacterium]|jgi:hypothetical protein
MTKTFTAVATVSIAAVLCGSLLLGKMHQNTWDNIGTQIARCTDRNMATHLVYVHTFYFRPYLIATRCTKD